MTLENIGLTNIDLISLQTHFIDCLEKIGDVDDREAHDDDV